MWGLWTWGLGASVLLAVAGAAVTWWSRERNRRLLTSGRKADAVVIHADPKVVGLLPDGIREYRSRVKVSYQADGRPVEQWLVLDDEEYQTGDRVAVFHHPRKPALVRTEASANRDFSAFAGIFVLCLGGGLLFVLLVLAVVRVLASPAL